MRRDPNQKRNQQGQSWEVQRVGGHDQGTDGGEGGWARASHTSMSKAAVRFTEKGGRAEAVSGPAETAVRCPPDCDRSI